MWEMHSIFQNSPKEILMLTLNIQSVNAKFDILFPVIDNLASQGLYFWSDLSARYMDLQ